MKNAADFDLNEDAQVKLIAMFSCKLARISSQLNDTRANKNRLFKLI